MLKRISLMLAFAILLTLVPMAALAEGAAPCDEPERLAFWDFETDPLEQGWQFKDEDGDGQGWAWHENTYGHAYEGTGNIDSFSYSYGLGGDLHPDNWAITPAVQLTSEQVSVTLYAKGYVSGYCSEHFAVYAATSDEPDRMTLVMPEAVTEEGYVQYTADLSMFANQRVFIAIRHFNMDVGESAICVDKVEVRGAGEVVEDPFVISEINIEGFTLPAWGEHPDYEINVPEGAHYSLSYYDWNWEDESGDYDELPEDAVFNDESLGYYMYMNVAAEEGYTFAENVVFRINGSDEYIRFMFPETTEVAILTSYFHVQSGGGEHIPGDVNMNGSVETADALLVLRAALGLIELDGAQLEAADMNGDDSVSITDAVVILRLALGLMQ